MDRYRPILDWIAGQQARMTDLLATWANVNSGSRNLVGLTRMLTMLRSAFARLGEEMETVPLQPQVLLTPEGRYEEFPLGEALVIRKRPDAKIRVFLGIHYDTVYPEDHPFQTATRVDSDRIQGPGVADAKGGAVVLLTALEALERSPWANALGWEVLLNPDEEIGSPGSRFLFVDAARRNHLALLFEPSGVDGSLVSSRKGSAVYSALIVGRAAHAGRNPFEGCNAILALADFVKALDAIQTQRPGVLVNVAQVSGGGPANVVPDLAFCRFNIRTDSREDQIQVERQLHDIVETFHQREGIRLEVHEDTKRPPKELDSRSLHFLDAIAQCAHDLGIELTWRASGGASDGNFLASEGIPTVDSLGVRGGGLHSREEYASLSSLTERAALTALLLMKLASGELLLPQ